MFFVQVARLEDPNGAGRERILLVGGSSTGRGVVTSASYEARAFGVRSGMATAHALRLCPQAVVVPVPRGSCARKSRAINDTLRRLSPVVQPASIDEFYLDLSGTERLFAEELAATARRIRETVLAETEISVSVGGGTSRIVAKLAVRRAKPAGTLVVPPGEEKGFVRTHRLEDLPGVGPAFAEELEHRGLVQVEDALRVEREWLRSWLGEGRADWLHDRMRGVDRTAVLDGDGRKSVSSERTFGRDLAEDRDVEREVLRLCVSVSSALREDGLRARTVTVKLRDGDFTTRQSAHTVPDPVETEPAVYAVALPLVRELRRLRRTGVRLLGVALSGLLERDDADEAEAQLGLFPIADALESDRDRALARVVDDLRDRFGRGAILPGRVLERDH
ncbi:MAG: DNA polymerase IV [Gemmatimonadetes bacterium]|nr:DNA polymerase IV [Gemmatimonadota bacterium]